MKKLAVWLTWVSVCFCVWSIFAGCSARSPYQVAGENDWRALFSENNLRNVTVRTAYPAKDGTDQTLEFIQQTDAHVIRSEYRYPATFSVSVVSYDVVEDGFLVRYTQSVETQEWTRRVSREACDAWEEELLKSLGFEEYRELYSELVWDETENCYRYRNEETGEDLRFRVENGKLLSVIGKQKVAEISGAPVQMDMEITLSDYGKNRITLPAEIQRQLS